MKRAQIYFDMSQWSLLKHLSKTFGEGISDLVRRAVDKSYRTGYNAEEFHRVLQTTAGLWKDRKGMRSGTLYENRMRKGWESRVKRWRAI